MRALLGLLLAASCLGGLGCLARPTVTRVYEGHVVEGGIVLPEQYATFLRGAMAEEQGDLSAALHAYEAASEMDPTDPEIWTRIGAVRCQKDPRDERARTAFGRAIDLDREYAAAWSARAKCDLLRGQDRAGMQREAERAVEFDPQATEPQVILATALAMQSPSADAARNRLLALTLKQRSSTAAWRALGAWAKSHRDPALAARAYGEVAKISPVAHAEVASVVLELAGAGELVAARSLAGALVDARRSTGAGPEVRGFARPTFNAEAGVPGNRLVARLAVDDAVSMGDRERVRRRAVSSHLALDVVAGRALLLGRPDMAREFAEPLVQADPRASGARLVLAILAYEADDKAGLTRAFADAGGGKGAKSGGDVPVVAEAILPFLRVVSRAMGPEIARRVATALPCETIVAGDALVVPLSVALADSGALAPDALSADGRLELAVRRGESVTGSLDALDARHRLLMLASTRPTSNEARALLRHMGASWVRDPLVAVAMGRMAVAGAVEVDATTPTRIAEVAPADPLVATTALELARKHGDTAAALSIGARLSAIATTPHQAR
ncbi:tetratricopeptide repeat protein [Pendulispora rubella]|uniref:Tetratricopeptide repeat protein n=1 Tax=Pendulispora rubella TaxID=2741070 RepID=A0ABZ2LDA8_9BACT